MKAPVVGVLALQGAFREHIEAFADLRVVAEAVKSPEALAGLDALVIPGGESTTIGKLLCSSALDVAIKARTQEGSLAIFGTCAGMILSARHVLDGVSGQTSLGIFDATVRRNAIGAQQMSFELALKVETVEGRVPAAFIRPPEVEEVDPAVEVMAVHRDKPVLCRQGKHMFATFHPELTGDSTIHRLFLENLR